MARRYVVQKIARTDTTIFKLERHLVTIGGRFAIAGLDEPADIEVRVFAAKSVSEVDRDVSARHGVLDVLDDFSDKLEMLAGQCPLLCLGHLNDRHEEAGVKRLAHFFQISIGELSRAAIEGLNIIEEIAALDVVCGTLHSFLHRLTRD